MSVRKRRAVRRSATKVTRMKSRLQRLHLGVRKRFPITVADAARDGCCRSERDLHGRHLLPRTQPDRNARPSLPPLTILRRSKSIACDVELIWAGRKIAEEESAVGLRRCRLDAHSTAQR